MINVEDKTTRFFYAYEDTPFIKKNVCNNKNGIQLDNIFSTF